MSDETVIVSGFTQGAEAVGRFTREARMLHDLLAAVVLRHYADGEAVISFEELGDGALRSVEVTSTPGGVRVRVRGAVRREGE